MKQILQDLKDGELLLQDVPAPDVRPGHVLIQTRVSLVSLGTERMLVDFGRGSYLDKARQQPDKVRQVFDKIRTDGLVPTIESVRAKLEQPLPMGYSNVGIVRAVGAGVEDLKVGDRVLSNGAHAEVVLVPKHLCARIPDSVADEAAVFGVVGAIALQGIRLITPTLGETVVVSGLGLIGLLAVQILRANGARVVGLDVDSAKVELARSLGARAFTLDDGVDPVQVVRAQTGGLGADAVLITASTDSHELIHQAADMSRKRGRIVLTGVIGLNLRRTDFYEKELSFQVSCSYGPGRYDPKYEEQGEDYPLPHVRWTEQRNFEAVLGLMQEGRVQTAPLLTRRVPFADAGRAYESFGGMIGVLLEYPDGPGDGERKLARVVTHRPAAGAGKPCVGVIGAGAFTQLKLLPAVRDGSARLKWIASAQGTSAGIAARRFAIENSTTDTARIFADPDVNAVVITTRHGSHARYVIEALRADKHVFVEKPLCLTRPELLDIVREHRAAATRGRPPLLMVGFNRRFAPLTEALRAAAQGRAGPATVICSCNAGAIPANHWVHDPEVGGGRILGEACHFVDLVAHVLGSPIRTVSALKLAPTTRPDLEDSACISLRCEDGSVATVSYFAGGARAYPKEQLQLHADGKTFELDNFRRLRAHGASGGRRLWAQDKGHRQGVARFLAAVERGGESPTPLPTVINTTLATLAAHESMRSGAVIDLWDYGRQLHE